MRLELNKQHKGQGHRRSERPHDSRQDHGVGLGIRFKLRTQTFWGRHALGVLETLGLKPHKRNRLRRKLRSNY